MLHRPEDIQEQVKAVVRELDRAVTKHPQGMRSGHEGHSILREEMEEMWDAVKADDLAHAREEAVQVAAMALRFLLDVK